MFDITCLDAFGNVVNTFTQWDINQTLYIEDSGFPAAPIFHFCNRNTKRALCVESVMDEGGNLSVPVPNQLLIEPYDIFVYLYSGSGDSYKTIEFLKFHVRPRKRPADFLFAENVKVVHLKNLIHEVKELGNTITNAEQERMEHETIRISREETRMEAEQEREAAELSRVKSEAGREDAEKLRDAAEAAREENERRRETTEAAREANEAKRKADFAAAVQNTENAASYASTAAKNCEGLMPQFIAITNNIKSTIDVLEADPPDPPAGYMWITL